MSLFARSDLHKIQYGTKTENDIKNRKLSCSGQIISLPNGENRAKIRKGTAEILWRIYKKFTFLPAIFRLSSTLKLYNFYTVQDRGIQSLTHSLTAALDQLRVLHIERSWPAIQTAPTDKPTSSSTCCSQFLRGRPGGRFQSAAGGVPVWASIDS